jgi:xanthine dehydrogenase molybdopterin-binding subunit B
MSPTNVVAYHGVVLQIEGALIQGLGWVALVEIKWGDSNHKWIRPGHLFTCGPGSPGSPIQNTQCQRCTSELQDFTVEGKLDPTSP